MRLQQCRKSANDANEQYCLSLSPIALGPQKCLCVAIALVGEVLDAIQCRQRLAGLDMGSINALIESKDWETLTKVCLVQLSDRFNCRIQGLLVFGRDDIYVHIQLAGLTHATIPGWLTFGH